MLLRQIGQAVDRRSAGRAMGDFLHLRREHGLRRRLARQTQGDQRGRRMHTELRRARIDPASRTTARLGCLLRPLVIPLIPNRWGTSWTMLKSRKWYGYDTAASQKLPMPPRAADQ